MLTAREYLIREIEAHKADVIDAICNRLQTLPHSHYEVIAYEQHQEREEIFLNVLLQELRKDDTESLARYIKSLVEQRSNEGYDLREIEKAFDIIEDTLWERVLVALPSQEVLIDMLKILRNLFRDIKNSLTQMYVQEALTAQKQFEDISRKFATYRTRKGEYPLGGDVH